jgi:hypothetical protein
MRPLFFARALPIMPPMKIGWPIAILASLLLAGCGDPGDESTTVGGLTADEAAQLNDAAEMLDVANHPPLPGNTQAP